MKRLNCPLCTTTFGYSFGLECHLLSVHQEDLQKLRSKQDILLSHVSPFGCLCCAAQYLRLETLVKHCLESHPEFVLTSLKNGEFSNDFEDQNLSSNNGTLSLKRHFDCHFCGQKFLRRHQKLFLAHLEQKHVADLQSFLQESCMILTQVQVNLENIEFKLLQSLTSSNITFGSGVRSSRSVIPEPKRRSLSAQRVKSDRILDRASNATIVMNTYDKIASPHHYEVIQSPPSLTSTMRKIRKKLRRSESTSSSSSSQPRNTRPNFVNINQNTPVSCRTGHIRFKLSSYKSVPQPEPPGNSEEDDEDKRTTSTYSTNSDETNSNSTRAENYFAGNLFKCNLCEIAFAENAFLLTHLKNRHRSTVSKALKPHFSCGACPAKFFKNSFLIKHTECHGFTPSSSMQRIR